MDEVAIERADLDTIGRNLESVAEELSGVINNVNSVNDQINSIEANVFSLNDEVKGLIKELRETTMVNNARQTIMYNNEQINKKYGYFDKVRRKTESLLDAISNSNINKTSLIKLREELLLNNPNYWLSNALAAITSWILNDRENTEKELNNALRKDKEKTSAFFCLINLKLGRIDTSINWLNTYLDNEDPTSLSTDFITFLDLVSNNGFGNEGKEILIEKINTWISRINSTSDIERNEIERWKKYITEKEMDNTSFSYLDIVSKDTGILKNNLLITSSYEPMFNELTNITNTQKREKSIDEILNNLIYEYESEEQIYQKDNLKNNLVIEYNGDREKALNEYDKIVNIYDDRINLLELFTNIVIHKERYKISDETRKLALSLIKNTILKAYDSINSEINNIPINIIIDDFHFELKKSLDNNEINKVADDYMTGKFLYDDKQNFIYLAIITSVLLLAIVLSLSTPIITIIIILLLIGIDGYILYNIYKKRKVIDNSRINERKSLNEILTSSSAEFTEYEYILKNNQEKYEQLKNYLSNIESNNYLRTSNERDLDIGEHYE